MKKIFKISYRMKSGKCTWRCYSVKGFNYHLAIPITKWVFKFEPFWNWVYIAKNVEFDSLFFNNYQEAVAKIEKVIASCKTEAHTLSTIALIINFRKLYVSKDRKNKKLYERITGELILKVPIF